MNEFPITRKRPVRIYRLVRACGWLSGLPQAQARVWPVPPAWPWQRAEVQARPFLLALWSS